MSKSDLVIILAAPGVGKTTLAEQRDDVLDFDFGVIRKHIVGPKGPHDERWKKGTLLYPSLYEALMISRRWFSIIMLNEPHFAEYIKERNPNTRVVCVAPSESEDWIERVCTRDPDADFCSDLRANAEEWLPGWKKSGDKLDGFYPLDTGVYLPDVVDEILSDR